MPLALVFSSLWVSSELFTLLSCLKFCMLNLFLCQEFISCFISCNVIAHTMFWSVSPSSLHTETPVFCGFVGLFFILMFWLKTGPESLVSNPIKNKITCSLTTAKLFAQCAYCTKEALGLAKNWIVMYSHYCIKEEFVEDSRPLL